MEAGISDHVRPIKEIVDLLDEKDGSVTRQGPTEIGDVLILRTSRSYTVYAVGSVVTAGQHDFSHSEQVHHVFTHAEAVNTARAIVASGGRIYLVDIDTAEWSQIPN
jgi:hypothetical protein